MKSDVAKKRRALGRRWLHADEQIIDGELVQISKEDSKATTPKSSCLNNLATNLDDHDALLPNQVGKPEAMIEATTDEGEALELQALIDPGPYALREGGSSDDRK